MFHDIRFNEHWPKPQECQDGNAGVLQAQKATKRKPDEAVKHDVPHGLSCYGTNINLGCKFIHIGCTIWNEAIHEVIHPTKQLVLTQSET